MNLKIGSIIKRLRVENNITQDALATAIGVTPQAISRWEAEGGYPDIELLPSLADFFSVTTDELLGYRLSEREEKLADIKKEVKRLSEDGSIKDRINYIRTALAYYPSDCYLRYKLAESLYWLWYDTKDDSLLPEAESIALSAVNGCKDENTRHNAISTLISIYSNTHRTDDALRIIEMLTPMNYCREFVKSDGIGDGKTEFYIQDAIRELTEWLQIVIYRLVLSDDLPNDSSVWDKKIKMLEASNTLYSMIFGENMMFYHYQTAFTHQLISTYQIAQAKIEEALVSLEKCAEHAEEYTISYQNDHGKAYTSIFTDKLIYPYPSEDFENFEHPLGYYMLDRLEHGRYDVIRNNERFNSIKARLKSVCYE